MPYVLFKAKDPGQEKMAIALCLTLEAVFISIGFVKLLAILIDKSWTQYYVITSIVNKDKLGWKHQIISGEKIAVKLLVCRVYVMKVWSENLLPKVPNKLQWDMWRYLCQFILFLMEFNLMIFFKQFLEYSKRSKE